MFDGSLQALFKENGIFNEESVNVGTTQPAYIIVHTGITEVRMREGFFRTPGRIEEVFRTCTYQRGNLFSINEPHVVTFAIPHGSGTMHIVIDTYKVSLGFP